LILNNNKLVDAQTQFSSCELKELQTLLTLTLHPRSRVTSIMDSQYNTHPRQELANNGV